MLDQNALQQLYRYCYTLCCNEHNAYDLLQTAMEKFISSNHEATNPSAYIKRIIHNQFIDDCRRQKIIQFESLEEDNLPADFDTQTLETMIINDDMVDKILGYLNPGEREIIYFWAIEGLSTAEISEQLEIPKGTVLSKIYRMRKKLLEIFETDSLTTAEVSL